MYISSLKNMKKTYDGIKECHYRVSAKAVIRDEQWKFLLCLNDYGYWDIPGGGIDHWEEIHEALKREIMEEMWIQIISASSQPIYTYLIEGTVEEIPLCILCYKVELENYNFTPSEECLKIWFFHSTEVQDIKLYTPIQKIMKKIEKPEV
jgi:8-oxo-dGTP diphosphatase